MLTYDLDRTGGCSLYESLYRRIREDILAGRLAAGEKLPSKRLLAKHLSVSVITVENAYAQLAAEGYIYSLPKRGFFVEKLVPEDFPQPHPAPRSAPAVSTPKPVERNGWFADLVTNHIPAENFPFSTWAKLMRNVLSLEEDELMRSPSAQGRRELQEAIAGHLYHFRGMSVEPEQIVIGAGTEYLYGLLVQFLGRDKLYGVEEPGYQKPGQIYESCGARSVAIPMDDAGVQADALESEGVDVLHISPSHHFPTGIVMPVSRRYELLGWCARAEGRYILEDDYDCEFRTSGRPIPTLQSIDASDRVIYINTFSKTLASTIRIRYMVLPRSLVEPFHKKLGFYACTVSSFEQLVLAQFIREGYFEKHLNRMRNHYKTQKASILQQLRESPIASKLSVRMENEGLHFLLEVHADLEDRQLIEAAQRRGVRICCLSQYYRGVPTRDHVIVLNYAGLPSDRTGEAVSRLIESIAAVIA